MLAKVTHLLPLELQQLLTKLPSDIQQDMEEIRVREARPLEIGFRGQSRLVAKDGTFAWRPDEAFIPSEEQCRTLLEKISNYSLYSIEEELRRGYITVSGGHRIGLVGRTILEQGHVKGIRDIGAFNIRIAREMIGAGTSLLPKLLDTVNQSIHSTLIIAPPQHGKTTMIRDLARSISYGYWPKSISSNWSGKKVGIVDERSEIAACVRGIPTFDVGPRTDVMDACPKAEGMMMMLRSMSPEILIADEIGRQADGEAIIEASHAGIRVIATAHAFDMTDVLGRPIIKKLMEEGAFRLVVQLRKTASGIYHHVIDTSTLLQTNNVETNAGTLK
ncbi:stage III sporulation protein AA [Paenibacillus yanchengensis]|uniref:Stage III sporulation protein AA n=1 Tax=Paenibacillus yanchengensis TaxID=2035833 RepID=A0ABW4YKA9_9BACL